VADYFKVRMADLITSDFLYYLADRGCASDGIIVTSLQLTQSITQCSKFPPKRR